MATLARFALYIRTTVRSPCRPPTKGPARAQQRARALPRYEGAFMSASQGSSETPEPPWVKKFVVGLYCGAAYHDVAFAGHGGVVRLFDFDACMCALARLFFLDENVVR